MLIFFLTWTIVPLNGVVHLISRIVLAQKRAAQVILDVRDNCCPSKEMFLTLNWMPTVEHKHHSSFTVIIKSLKDFAQEHIANMFKFVREDHERTTRSTSRKM